MVREIGGKTDLLKFEKKLNDFGLRFLLNLT